MSGDTRRLRKRRLHLRFQCSPSHDSPLPVIAHQGDSEDGFRQWLWSLPERIEEKAHRRPNSFKDCACGGDVVPLRPTTLKTHDAGAAHV